MMNTNTPKSIDRKSTKRLHRIAVAVTAAFALVFLSAVSSRLQAATITVTSAGDNGAGTLRAALASAANGDKIIFSLPTPATITLINGELLITNNLTITGPGAPTLA